MYQLLPTLRAIFKDRLNQLLILLLLITIAVTQNIYSPLVQALTMYNTTYMVEMGNLNMTAGKKSNGAFTLTDTVGQTAPGFYPGTNYNVYAGFQYIYSVLNFKFQISSQNITFGILDPTSPVTRTQILTVSNYSALGYNVFAQEDHQLLSFPTGISIPNTTCDSGTCTTTTPSVWKQTLTYGFGYRCDAITTPNQCPSDFPVSPTPDYQYYYKQFADISAGQSPVAVMTGTTAGTNKQVQITFKVNVSAAQQAGQYINQIIYIAVPTF